MVSTRGSANRPQSQPFALIQALLNGQSGTSKLALQQQQGVVSVLGPSGFSCLHAAALSDSHRLVPLLVASGAVPVDQQIAPLDGAAASTLRAFLKQHSKLPSSKLCAVFRGVTPLHIASWLGHSNTVQALLDAGADTETACLEGRTALAIACYFLDCRPKRSLAIIEALLAAGADPLCADFHGIGSLVLSPHCPPLIQKMLLDRVLLRYSGTPVASTTAAAGSKASEPSKEAGGEQGGAAAAAAAEPGAGAASEVASSSSIPERPPPLHLQLLPHKHVDVLQASLGAKHWGAFNFFLAATSGEVEYPSHAVNRILSMAIVSGAVPLVLRILHSGLRPDAGGVNSQGQPHVAVAAVHGHEAVLDVLCQHGGSVTLKALHHATDSRSIRGLRLLLARGRPPVLSSDAPVHIGGAHSRSGELCVMLRLLRDTAFRLRYCYRIDMPRHAADSLEMVEVLADAGYRPTCYPQAIVHNGWIDMQGRLVQNYDPTVDKPSAFDLQGVNRYTWLAAKREPWTQQRHAQWPPKFKEAVQQLLLVYHHGRQAAVGRYATAEGSHSGPLTRAAKRARLEVEFGRQQRPAAAALTPAVVAPPMRLGMSAPTSKTGAAAATVVGSKAAPVRQKRGLRTSIQQQQGKAAGQAVAAPAGQPAAISRLPPELMLHIIQQAAYPISAWVVHHQL